MKKLVLLVTFLFFTLLPYRARTQVFLHNVFSKPIEHKTDVEELQEIIGIGKIVNNELVYKISDDLNGRDVRGTVIIKLKNFKTWYNSEYKGIDGLSADLTINQLNPEDKDYDGSKWNWDLYQKINSYGSYYDGFVTLDKSEGSQSKHFIEKKKDNLIILISIEPSYEGLISIEPSYEGKMLVKVSYKYEE